jgi:hypothetical protein
MFVSVLFFSLFLIKDFCTFLYLLRGGSLPPLIASISEGNSLIQPGKPYMVNDKVNGMVNVMVSHLVKRGSRMN